MKLHIGSGTVYLKDYINLDAAPHYLAQKAPKYILEQNTTTIDNYYKHKFCKGSGVCVADIACNVNDLPFDDNSIEEIVMLHVLEHLPSYEVQNVLDEFHRVLKQNGKLYLAVPDIKGTAQLLASAKTPQEEEWAIRLIYGTQRNEFSHHYCGYIRRTLINLLKNHGFDNFVDLPNINFYPAIHLEATKL